MKKGLHELVMIIDRSGSMQTTREDAEGGLRKFVDELRKLPVELKVTLYRFDDIVEHVMESRPIGEVRDDQLKIEPRGFTALLDAMGTAIDDTGQRLARMHESSRPERVIVLVVTDGEENHSKRFTRSQVFDKVQLQRDKYNWEFTFLGANQDAIKAGGQLGFHSGASLDYAQSKTGTRAVYAAAAGAVAQAIMSAGPVVYSAQQRQDAMANDDDLKLVGK